MRVLSTGLLMGAAASLAMTSGAGAADLPMKAKAPAVQYVKICTLYGAGFYYIPGTDTCLKIGGHLRVDAFYGPSGGVTESVDYNANWDRADQRYFNTRTRAYATFDARAQTAYGTLRSYFLIGATMDGIGDGDDAPNGQTTNVYMIRAFIQLAGFTWGLSDSIFDAYSITPFHLNYVAATNGSIGASGIWQWRYTAQFGNGFSASVAVEEPRTRIKPIIAGSIFPTGFAPLGAHVGAEWPDVIGQLQASGAWGRAQVAFAVKDASAVNPANPLTSIDEIGWAAMIGGFLRVPGMPGDTFGFQFTYAEGATDYVTGNANNGAGTGQFYTTKDALHTLGFVTDGVITSVAGGGAMSLTTSWGFELGYEHAWSPTLKTSLAGGWVQIEYDAAARAVICAGLPASCDPDTSFWNVGSRTQWSPVPNFSLALDVMYTHIDTATPGAGVTFTRPGDGRALGFGDADIWTAMVRVRRDYWP